MKEDLEKYRMSKIHAACRGIPFELTFEEWITWWKETGFYDKRGRKGDEYCMCRKGDTGPYSLENIYCDTNTNNVIYRNLLKNNPNFSFKGKKHSKETIKKISQVNINRSVLSDDIILERKKLYEEIDFSKCGALNKYAKAINVSHTTARRFIEQYVNCGISSK